MILINPARDDETFEVFSHLYPKNVNYKDANQLLFGLVDENKAIAAMAVNVTDEAYMIHWFFVDPNNRRQGVATYLLNQFVCFVEESFSLREIEISFSNANRDFMEFIKTQIDFEVASLGKEFYIDKDSILSEDYSKLLSKAKNFDKWSALSEGRRQAFIDNMSNDGMFIPLTPYWQETLAEDLCFVKEKDFRISSVILVSDEREEDLEVLLLYSEDKVATMELVASALKIMIEEYPGKGLYMTAVNEVSEKLITTLFPNSTLINEKFLASWNYF